jgi:hypothetical protein
MRKPKPKNQYNLFDPVIQAEKGGDPKTEEKWEFFDSDGKIRVGVIVRHDPRRNVWTMDSWGEKYRTRKLRRKVC